MRPENSTPTPREGKMRAREFDIKLIDTDIEEFKNLLDVFRDVFEWSDHDHPDEEYLLRLLRDENLLVLVAKVGNEVVGGLTAYVLPGYEVARPSVYVHDLGVKKSFQGQGVGKSLIGHLMDHAKNNDFHDIFVDTEQDDNEDAIAFYRKTPFDSETKVLQYAVKL